MYHARVMWNQTRANIQQLILHPRYHKHSQNTHR